MHMKSRFSSRPLPLVAALAMLFSGTSQAIDLLQVYREARANDAVFNSARATLEAGRERLPQGRALLLPTINLTGTSSYTDGDVRSAVPNAAFTPRQFTSNVWTVTLNQPLFRKANLAQYQQAEFQVVQSEAQFGQASQDLIIRAAQAYFDVLTSQDSLAVIQAQKSAITEQLEQAKRNFEVGTTTITDTHEAQARYDLSTSQEIAARNDLEFRQRALQQIIGRLPDALVSLRPKLQLSPPQPSSMDAWVDRAQRENFTVRVQEAALEVAGRDVERVRAGRYPTLDLVGSYGNNSVTGSTGGNAAGSDIKTTVIGLQLAFPLYTGGATDSRIRESLALQEKVRSDLENSRRQAALSARQAFLGVTNGMAQVRALEQAVVSSETALASNRLGYEVGVRINIDVLNSQQQVFQTRRDMSRARYDTIMNGLRLKAATGNLTEADVEEVNRLLGSS